MASLVATIRETLRYRGALGQWSWVLHRLTGLGVVLFLVIHVIDTSWAVFLPGEYEKAIAIYQTPLFTLGEFGLVFAVVYHALNGLRISIMDYRPELWRYQERAAYYVLGGTAVILLPVFWGMMSHVIEHYRHDPQVLPLSEVLLAQIPFAAGMVLAAIVALLFSWIAGFFSEDDAGEVRVARNSGSQMETFWWSFMRISGVLIIPLVFGHLALMHVLQGVFELNAAGALVVGTDMYNTSGTATEFVHDRWSYMLGPLALWRVYDIALLSLVTVHGFNGLRYVLTDYTMDKPLLRRASIYLCIIGGLTLLVVGGLALIYGVPQDNIAMATEALAEIYGEG